MPKLLTVKETIELLQISRATLYNLINKKGLPFVKVGRGTRFDVDALNAWLKENN